MVTILVCEHKNMSVVVLFLTTFILYRCFWDLSMSSIVSSRRFVDFVAGTTLRLIFFCSHNLRKMNRAKVSKRGDDSSPVVLSGPPLVPTRVISGGENTICTTYIP